MAIFNSAVLTKKGNELLIDAAAGNKITFTRMVVGCGEYTDAERERNTLEKMESLKDAKQEFTFSAYKKVSEQCFLLTAVISNRELTKGYKITEIGICGKISDDEEDFLCSVAVTNSMEESDTFPPYNGLQECQIVQDYYITISPDAEVTVITRGASVLVEDFLTTIEEIKREFKEKIEALKKSFQDGVDKIFNYLKGLGFTPTDSSPDAICVAIQNIYDGRYLSGYEDGRTQGHADVIADPTGYGISIAPVYYGHIWSRWTAINNVVYTCPETRSYTIIADPQAERNEYGSLADGNTIKLYIGAETIDLVHNISENNRNIINSGTYTVTKMLPAGTQISVYVEQSIIQTAKVEDDHMARYVYNGLTLIIS